MLVRATTLGALALAPIACGDDGNTGTSVANTTDLHPTAGPCFHTPNPPPECESTGVISGSGSTSTAGTVDSGADVHPTAGPCAHDPQAPECASTTDTGSDSGTDTEATTGTGTGTGTDTGTGTSSG
jgi:hypothetical protein